MGRELRTCPTCGEIEPNTERRIWCPTCGKAYDVDEARATLRSVKVGPGVIQSPAVEEFWSTGDPDVFNKKTDHPPVD